MNTLVEAISADMEHLTEDLLENHSSRLFSRGGHFTKDQMIPVYFALIFGCGEMRTLTAISFSALKMT